MITLLRCINGTVNEMCETKNKQGKMVLRWALIKHLWYWTWWRHQMETFSALLALSERNPPDSLTTASDAELWYILWSAPEQTLEQTKSRRRWFDTPSSSLWRYYNDANVLGEPFTVMAADALAPCIARSSKIMALTTTGRINRSLS